RPDLPAGAQEQRDRHDRLAGARRNARDRRRAGAARHVPGQAVRAVRAAPAVGGAGVARRDRVDVDLRFHVQRDQLDAQGRGPHARLVVLAGRPRTRAARHHHRAGMADFSLRHRDRARRTGVDRRVPAPVPVRGRRRDAAIGPPHGSGGAMKRLALYAAALGFVVFAGFPFYWMLITAFKQNRDLYVGASDLSHIPWIFNDPPTLDHVKLLLGQTDFPRWVLNTLVVVVAVVAITVAVAVPAGYSLARLVGRWGERMGMGIFFTYLIPPTLLFVPFSRLISLLGLQDSLGALILIYPTMTIPFCTWLVMGFLRSVPWEIEEQAMIDGYSRLAVILKVAPRLIVPGILTVVVFSFTLVLQE